MVHPQTTLWLQLLHRKHKLFPLPSAGYLWETTPQCRYSWYRPRSYRLYEPRYVRRWLSSPKMVGLKNKSNALWYSAVTWASWRLKSLQFDNSFDSLLLTKKIKLHISGPSCEGNPPVTNGFPAPRTSDAESVPMSWSPHDINHQRG